MIDFILGCITLALFLGIIVTGYIVHIGYVLLGWKKVKKRGKNRVVSNSVEKIS